MRSPKYTLRIAALAVAAAGGGLAQITTDQKIGDFQSLAALFAKQYAPYEWKRDALGFDLLKIGPWLDRVRATRSDLDFYEVMLDYVASLNDAHSVYTVPSNFLATLNFTTDIYDGRVLIDSINRTRLPAALYPFQAGDELVSVDGAPVEQLIEQFLKYSTSANPRSTRRNAAGRITSRPQSRMPHAVDVADEASVVIRRQSGDLETYAIAWTKTGLPLTVVGPVLTPKPVNASAASSSERMSSERMSSEEMSSEEAPDYMAVLRQLQRCEIQAPLTILGLGARSPIFAPPAGFVQRLGRVQADFFYSGTFEAEGYKIGFSRIPSYSPPNAAAALQQFRTEIAYFQANTGGLVIDEMRNPGGSLSFLNSLTQLVIPYRYRTVGFQVRATSEWVVSVSRSLENARAQNAPQWVQDLLGHIKSDMVTANSEMRGRTGSLPIDDVTLDRDPARGPNGELLAYTKPLVVLMDEMSASGGDIFPATLQDNGRGLLFGFRTMGAGGSVVTLAAGTYSEGVTGMTQTLIERKLPVVTADYPAAPYIENIGVRPDVELDYMTKENLLQNGRPFVNAFVQAIVDQIRKAQ
ncbi:MAG: S41 family peptidase [Bryobacteraceae bacterium]